MFIVAVISDYFFFVVELLVLMCSLSSFVLWLLWFMLTWFVVVCAFCFFMYVVTTVMETLALYDFLPIEPSLMLVTTGLDLMPFSS